MSRKENNSVRAAYVHKAKHLEQYRLMLQWWVDFLDADHNSMVRPFEFAHITQRQESQGWVCLMQ